ncbi:MAG: ABC transporter ATP-binding protein [Candidatus Eremiobacteraeota bacterium]|nr:ABC transporter ATP-binding protein [Candidatus Eremiobacteraeota bacterium]
MNGFHNGAGAAPALRIEQLVKRYGEFVAVDGISLEVARGDFFGFLGPNGAGKTTSINAVVGLATLTSGTIEIFGHDNVRAWREARRLVGLAPQEYNFDRYLSIRDVLIYQAGYYGLRGPAVRKRADELLERFGLTSKSGETFVRLSGGMKRRLTLARALIHEPELLILDEPTAGVDVELRIELWEMLRGLNAAGTTIILTTHYLEEAESLCKNIAIIEGGRIVAMESTAKLLARRGSTTLSVTVERPLDPVPFAIAARSGRYDARTRTLHFEGIAPAQIAPALAELESNGYTIENVDFTRSSLQDVFLDLVGRA